jgi:hypothetical protein
VLLFWGGANLVVDHVCRESRAMHADASKTFHTPVHSKKDIIATKTIDHDHPPPLRPPRPCQNTSSSPYLRLVTDTYNPGTAKHFLTGCCSTGNMALLGRVETSVSRTAYVERGESGDDAARAPARDVLSFEKVARRRWLVI